MQLLHSFAFALTFISSLATASTNQTVPAAPSFEHLFTLLVDCTPRIFTTQTPKGLRTAIPIVGGNFTGPRLSGEILNLGADWGLTDPQTGIFSPDTRYQLQTNDGANIYIQTSGSLQPDATVHLRLIFETGDKKYYWLNNVIGEIPNNASS